MSEPTCVPGCKVFYGGERKHHRDCPHYPESLTKIGRDTEAKYIAEIDRMRAALCEILEMCRGADGAPMTADRWIDRIEERAKLALEHTQ